MSIGCVGDVGWYLWQYDYTLILGSVLSLMDDCCLVSEILSVYVILRVRNSIFCKRNDCNVCCVTVAT